MLITMFALVADSTAADIRASAASITITRIGGVTTEFLCKSSPTGVCNYLILSSLCDDKLLADGTREKTCRYSQAAPPFQLKRGEKKAVANLPADFVYTMKADAAPTPADCLNSPIPH